MKTKYALLLLVLLLACVPAMAQRPGTSGAKEKEDFNIWDVDFDKLDEEDRDRIERYKEEAREDTLRKLRDAAVPKEKDYDNNTVCSFGPQFREVSGRLTDEWYMFTPLDLSREGVQTYELIAGNMYVIGEVTVTVKNGTVTVDYAYNSTRIQGGREYFMIFADFESVTGKAFENLHQQRHYTYGRAYSIEEKLGGDTDVLLFVCNTATFKKSTPGVVRYYETNEDRELLRQKMLDMIGK